MFTHLGDLSFIDPLWWLGVLVILAFGAIVSKPKRL